MSLIERLADVEVDPDGSAGVPEEDRLRQFLFIAIQDYLEEHLSSLLDWLETDEDEMPDPDWVDEYGNRPLSEPSGLDRAGAG